MKESEGGISWRNWFIAFCLVLLAVVPLSLYFWVFGPLSGYKLAETDQSWANFGSFIGGTIGPVVSFAAFIGLLKTIQQQQYQISQARKDATIDKIQSPINKLCDIIDKKLYSTMELSIFNFPPMTLDHALTAISESLKGHGNPLISTSASGVSISLHQAIGAHIITLSCDFNLLCHYWDEYLAKGGQPEFVRLQQKRYALIVTRIRECGHRQKSIEKYFNLNELIKMSNDETCMIEDIWEKIDNTPLPVETAD